MGRHEGRLDENQLFELMALSQGFRLVDDDGREFTGLQPHPDHRVPHGQGDNGVEPRLLQRRGKEHRGVQAGRDAGLENVAGETDFLAVLLETGRGQRVGHAEVGDGRVDRRGDLPHPLAASRIVAVDAVGLARLSKDQAGIAQHTIHRRVIRHGK